MLNDKKLGVLIESIYDLCDFQTFFFCIYIPNLITKQKIGN